MRDQRWLKNRIELLLEPKHVVGFFLAMSGFLTAAFLIGVFVGKHLTGSPLGVSDLDPMPVIHDDKPQATALPAATPPGVQQPANGDAAAARGAAGNDAGAASGGELLPTKMTGSSFTLQLSSFQDRREVEKYAANLERAGLEPYIIKAEIPDRGGIWYRVRVGEFGSWEEAVSAKEEIEAKHHVVAYVTRK